MLEAESQSRLNQFNQKDVSMVFSSSMKLHPGSQHPLTEACLAGLEKNLERERHPQTLFLLLSYYRLKWRSLQPLDAAVGGGATSTNGNNNTPPNPEQLLTNRWEPNAHRGGVTGSMCETHKLAKVLVLKVFPFCATLDFHCSTTCS